MATVINWAPRATLDRIWAAIVAEMRAEKAELDRWADDGGMQP